MVDKSISPLQTSFRLFFVSGQSRQTTFSCKKASSIDFCSHFPSPSHGMTLHPPLASRPLKRKPVARGRKAPRKPSIVGWFFVLPWLVSVADSVAEEACYLAFVPARAPPAVSGEDATSVIVRTPPLELSEQV
jgi:hypothetical protein